METFQKIGIKIDTSLTALVTEYRFIKKNIFRRPPILVNPSVSGKFTKHQGHIYESDWISSNKAYLEALDINNQIVSLKDNSYE